MYTSTIKRRRACWKETSTCLASFCACAIRSVGWWHKQTELAWTSLVTALCARPNQCKHIYSTGMALRNDYGCIQPNPHPVMLFSPFGCIYQPTTPFRILHAHTELISQGNCRKWHHKLFDITNCLTSQIVWHHKLLAIAFKVAWRVMQNWRFELILSHAEKYHVFLKTILLRF